MTATRIGDAAQSARNLAAIQAANARLRAGQTEVATGKSAQRYDEISSDAGLLVRTKGQRALAETYIRQNEQIGDRLQAMDGALANLGGIAERMRTLLVQRLDAATGRLVPVDREAETLLAEAAAQLNLRLDERYLFAGSRTDAAPVEIPAGVPLTTADPTIYYRGDDVTVSVRADRDVEVSYGLTAADPAFANLLAGLSSAREAHLANDRGAIQAALGRVEAAVGQMAELRGESGAASARIEAITDTQRGTAVYLGELVARIEDVNLPETLARNAQDQAGLEAAYLTTSRIGQLSLADYLR
jgi:flagellar hook-associated protein 3 FlgL